LSKALEEGKKRCEEMVFKIPETHIRKSILGIEKQSEEYAHELNAQIETMGGESKDVSIEMKSPYRSFNSRSRNIEKEILVMCRVIERSVIKLYSKILNDPILTDGFKEVIRAQMNGIMRSTLQLKLANKIHLTG
jgi:hypothetical protein